jgi:hypothetical protein
MAIQQNPNDPYRPNPVADDIQNSPRLDQGSARLEQDLRADADRQSPVTGGRVAALAAAVLVALGLVYYGMNSTATGPNQAVTTAPTSVQSDQTAASGVRNVTPNSAPGTTTGSAPARPAPATPGGATAPSSN